MCWSPQAGRASQLDAVRYLGNRSSGRMGVAVADEAARRGADVTLILAAATASPSAPMRTLRAETAEQLRAATLEQADGADVIVMAAAVADYRPAQPIDGKRSKDSAAWTIELEATADILAELGARRREGQVLIGFAAEHGEGAVERARDKLERKDVDMIVMNDISRSRHRLRQRPQRNRAGVVQGRAAGIATLETGLRRSHSGHIGEPNRPRRRRAAYDGLTRGHLWKHQSCTTRPSLRRSPTRASSLAV